jgi:S1-C subfamily serine protease
MKSVWSVILTLALLAGSPSYAQWSTAAHSLRESTTFLRVVYRDGSTERTIGGGTGFFVAGEDSGKTFIYLVTNRHVAAPMVNGVPAASIGEYARLNLAQPRADAEWEEIPLPMTGPASWSFPDDPNVDLAVLPLVPDLKKFRYRVIPTSAFATSDVIKSDGTAEGDDVILAGFFYPFSGRQKFQPLVRHGILAMLPDEKLPTPTGGDAKLYLIDLHILHGNSGSPVMVCSGSPGPKGVIVVGSGCLLLGVVGGFYFENEELELTPTTTVSGQGKANSGVSWVVPADELADLLNAPRLRASRKFAN